MMDKTLIKAILFDSGRTLNVPRTGQWHITPNFYEIIDKDKITSNPMVLRNAMGKASDYINKILKVSTQEEEFLMFKEFYRIALNEIQYPVIDDNVLTALAKDNVYNDEKFLFFDDVEPSLKVLVKKYKVGVVSDTWPSLERVFVNRGLRKYFSTFIMSSIYGSSKAEKILLKIAIDELNVKANETLFIDDSESNLKAVEEFGMIPILIDRYDRKELQSKYPIIRSLEELSKLKNLEVPKGIYMGD
ncbi:HAD family hydrolase [Clostridium estertheticum]|uniref:HAD family hydrolase n=1 Tax=Clostridium estertheticum TaxID=238834 RepID=UPI001C6E95F6|nr:HAD-IA family hydrolase [Clostridium estertheticum]MBW9154497.1 HAD-IA family hydrolase [Clostridium estertheticum]WLC86451.1 HAD-IA family hydrolase [Clostridium estertheticum]